MAIKEEANEKDLHQDDFKKQSNLNPSKSQNSGSVDELLKKQIEDQNRQIKELRDAFETVLKTHKSSSKEDTGNIVAELKDDWVESPTTFFTHRYKHLNYGYRSNGKVVESPNGEPVRFTPLIRTIKKSGKNGSEVMSVCVHISNSRKVNDFLRNHPDYGSLIFENLEHATRIDHTIAMRLSEQNNLVDSLSDQQVLQRTKYEGLEVLADVKVMRQNLIMHLARVSDKKLKENLYANMTNIDEEDRLIKQAKIEV